MQKQTGHEDWKSPQGEHIHYIELSGMNKLETCMYSTWRSCLFFPTSWRIKIPVTTSLSLQRDFNNMPTELVPVFDSIRMNRRDWEDSEYTSRREADEKKVKSSQKRAKTSKWKRKLTDKNPELLLSFSLKNPYEHSLRQNFKQN